MTKNNYSIEFEAFWTSYPRTPIMSKKNAWVRWAKLSPDDQQAAADTVQAFKDYCRKNPTYHPVHAERYLYQRRFDGFGEVPKLDPETIATNMDRADRLLRRGKYAPDYR